MSTRSIVGIIGPNGLASTQYVHSDGYPSYVGKMLLENYSSREKVKALLELGDLSSLRDSPTSTVAYHRDRGEDLAPPWVGMPEKASQEEYLYLFDARPDSSNYGGWLYAVGSGRLSLMTYADTE